MTLVKVNVSYNHLFWNMSDDLLVFLFWQINLIKF